MSQGFCNLSEVCLHVGNDEQCEQNQKSALRTNADIQGGDILVEASVTEIMIASSRTSNKHQIGKGMPPGLGLTVSMLAFAICLWLTWGIVSEANWPTAAGVVDHSLIGTRKDTLSKNATIVHCLNLVYTYEVDGKKYSNLSELAYSRSETDMKLKSRDFGSGSIIPVRYNPKKPQEAYLSHRMAEAPLPVLITITGFSLLFALGELFALVSSRFRKT